MVCDQSSPSLSCLPNDSVYGWCVTHWGRVRVCDQSPTSLSYHPNDSVHAWCSGVLIEEDLVSGTHHVEYLSTNFCFGEDLTPPQPLVFDSPSTTYGLTVHHANHYRLTPLKSKKTSDPNLIISLPRIQLAGIAWHEDEKWSQSTRLAYRSPVFLLQRHSTRGRQQQISDRTLVRI